MHSWVNPFTSGVYTWSDTHEDILKTVRAALTEEDQLMSSPPVRLVS